MKRMERSWSYAWARNLSVGLGVVMLSIGGVVVWETSRPTYATPIRLGIIMAGVALVASVLLLPPGLAYLFFNLFMRPWRMWPMGTLLVLAEMQAMLGAFWLWQMLWHRAWSGWFGWFWIVYTAVPGLIVVLLILAMRDLAMKRRSQSH